MRPHYGRPSGNTCTVSSRKTESTRATKGKARRASEERLRDRVYCKYMYRTQPRLVPLQATNVGMMILLKD